MAMPKQTPSDLPINGHYEHFAATQLTPEQISGRYPVDWEQYNEDGLGKAAIAGFYLLDGSYYMLRHLYQAAKPATTIMLAEKTEDPSSRIEEVCENFKFTTDDLLWIRKGLIFRNVDLYRQDDNGSEFCISRFPFRANATAQLRKLAKGGLKQFYEIRTADHDTMTIETDSDGFLLKSKSEQK